MVAIVTGTVSGYPRRIRNADGSVGVAREFQRDADAAEAFHRELLKKFDLCRPGDSMVVQFSDGQRVEAVRS